ncbi:hypothetical protein EYF80_015019 [Liparis tanakae]|uniref:Uncharacterized protein n=1 Tax=Liparis tanakae TaxID=230148 RepID=A0A4Z2IAB2_9TELE|nr:hypothetical protein EYF80_015019 [Liparis tanakae]
MFSREPPGESSSRSFIGKKMSDLSLEKTNVNTVVVFPVCGPLDLFEEAAVHPGARLLNVTSCWPIKRRRHDGSLPKKTSSAKGKSLRHKFRRSTPEAGGLLPGQNTAGKGIRRIDDCQDEGCHLMELARMTVASLKLRQ